MKFVYKTVSVLSILTLVLSAGCAGTTQDTTSAGAPVGYSPNQEKLAVVIVNGTDRGDDIKGDLDVLKKDIEEAAVATGGFASVGDQGSVTLTVRVTSLKKVDGFSRAMLGVFNGPARVVVDYSLAYNSGMILRSGKVTATSDNMGAVNGVTTQAFTQLSQKLVTDIR